MFFFKNIKEQSQIFPQERRTVLKNEDMRDAFVLSQLLHSY